MSENLKKISFVVVAIIVCIVILKLLFNLSNRFSITKLASNIIPSEGQTASSLPIAGESATNNDINTKTEASIIEGKNLAEFDSSNDWRKPQIMGTVVEAIDLVNEISKVTTIAGDFTDKNKIQESLTAIDSLIKIYPDQSFLYVVKVWYSLKLGNTNYSEMNSDLDLATKYAQQNDKGLIEFGKYKATVFNSTISLLRTKVSSLSGDKKEVDYLMNSVKEVLSETKGDAFLSRYFVLFYNQVYAKTELQLSFFNSLVQSYPNDFRVYLLRGIYYGGNINPTDSSEKYLSLALSDFNKAIKLNPKSSDAHYFIGKLYTEQGMDSKNLSNSIKYLNKALNLDPVNKYTYFILGVANMSLGNYNEAIDNFGKAIELDTENVSAYYFRSVVKDYLNKFSPYGNQTLTEGVLQQEKQAIADISKAIQIKENSPYYSFYKFETFRLYEVRAGYYFKIRDGLNAIKDYDKVIGALLANQISLMDMKTIRSIYPEFSDVSDENLIEGLRQKYYPFRYSKNEFYELVMNNKKDNRELRSKEEDEDYMNQYILSYFYLQRGEAYYNSGDKHKASIEYKRMTHSSPEYPVDQERLARMNEQ